MHRSLNRLAITIAAGLAPTFAAALAHGQTGGTFAIPWFTVDGGGNSTPLVGGTFALRGTIGQPDASPVALTGGAYVCQTGFWAGVGGCPADFNGSGTVTVQDIFDFLNAWFVLDPRTDFNGVGGVTVQDIFDFLNAWFTGC